MTPSTYYLTAERTWIVEDVDTFRVLARDERSGIVGWVDNSDLAMTFATEAEAETYANEWS